MSKRVRVLIRYHLGWRAVPLVGTLAAVAASFIYPRYALVLALFATSAILLMIASLSERARSHHYRLADFAQSGVSIAPPSPPTPAAVQPVQGADDDPLLALARLRDMRENMSTGATSPDGVTATRNAWASDQPLVTVVVPNFNDGKYLADCLESLIRQSVRSWTAIVVDDCSTDDSVAIASEYARRDSRISLIRHYRNSGLSASRNTGLRATSTPYVTFLDSDDFLLTESLSDRLNTILSATDEHLAGVFCGVRSVPNSSQLDDFPDKYKWNPPLFHDFVSTEGECPFNAHAPLLYTEIVLSCGGFDETMTQGAEDWDLWQRMMRVGYYFSPSKYRSAAYRQKPRSMVRSMPAQHLMQAQSLLMQADTESLIHRQGASGPVGLSEPLSKYGLMLRQTKRICSYLGLAAVAGDDQLQLALDLLPTELPLPLLRNLDLPSLINVSLQRALSLDPAGLEFVESGIAPIRDHLVSQVHARMATPKPVTRTTPHFDFVFRPTDAHQAAVMVAEAARLPGTVTHLFVTSDRIDGDQGAETRLEAEAVAFISDTDWALHGGSSNAIIMMYPPTPTTIAALAEARAEGVRIVELEEPGVAVPRLDCHNVEPPDAIVTSVDTTILERAKGPGQNHRSRPKVQPQASIPPFLGQIEEYPRTRFDAADLNKWKNTHIGERVFILGNGPSLNDLDLTRLKAEKTIAVNGIFYAAEAMGFDPTYYVVEDTSVMSENIDAIQRYSAGHKFFPSIYRNLHGEDDNVTFFMMNRGFYEQKSPNYCLPRFSTNPAATVYAGQSVTIMNLQLAYYMGFSEVILIGMDFSYSIPESATRKGDVLTSMEDDPNHFHPNYFGKGKTWKDPKLDRVLANYALAKRIYEADNRRIVNATPGGKLELFERVEYNDLFSQPNENR